jgi:SAM-dependent methyltransferase
MGLKLPRWDELTHRSSAAYHFRQQVVMAPLKKLATLTPWFDVDAAEGFLIRQDQLWATHTRGASVFEIGCGPGTFRKDVLGRYGGVSYMGADIAPGMVADAKRTNPEHSFVAASATSVPFASRTFDVVAARFLFHHLPLPIRGACLTELRRVAKRCVIIQDVYGFPSGLSRHLYEAYYRVADGCYYRQTLSEWSELFATHGVRVLGSADSGPNTIVRRMACWVLDAR